MAMTTCKECGADVSTKAEACPKCGAKRPKPTGCFTWIVVGLIAFGALSGIFATSGMKDPPPPPALSPEAAAAKAVEDSRVTAAYACRNLVTKRLKDPDSAKWERPWYTTAEISEKNTRFKVQIQGRSKNSFGAYTLSIFDCDLRRSGDNWTPISIKEH